MSLKDRFKAAREQSGMTQLELAEIAGSTQVMISKIERGITLQPRNITQYAKILFVAPEFLLYGANPPDWYEKNEESRQDFYHVPLYTWSELASCLSSNDYSSQKKNKMICPNLMASKNTYAVSVSDDSMQTAVGNSYPNGSIIYVDPEKEHTAGDLVIAKTDRGITFKKLEINDFFEHYLTPLNKTHQSLFADFDVVGVVIGCYIQP